MYSPTFMENRQEKQDLEKLETRLVELENIADDLGNVPDEALVERLGRAVELLKEVNAGMENGMSSLDAESKEIGGLLDRVDFGAFDTVLGELEERERDADGR
ncbi:hypothetical protein BH24ACT22_BH24ACT22_20880 [soil metagenome]